MQCFLDSQVQTWTFGVRELYPGPLLEEIFKNYLKSGQISPEQTDMGICGILANAELLFLINPD